MFVLDVWLALASLFVVPIMFWFTQFVATYTRRGFRELQRSMGLALLFISHDLTVVRHVSHRTLVLYQGEIVEQGDAHQVHESPSHPYTRALLDAAPVPDPLLQRARRARAAA